MDLSKRLHYLWCEYRAGIPELSKQSTYLVHRPGIFGAIKANDRLSVGKKTTTRKVRRPNHCSVVEQEHFGMEAPREVTNR